MNQILELLMKLKSSLLTVFAVIVAFLTPIIPLILTVGCAIFLDTIMGLWKAKKLKEKTTSRKLSKIISKMVLYESATILFFCIEKFILGDFILLVTSIPFVLTKIVAAILVTVEVVSINENYHSISGVNLWQKFKLFLARTKTLKSDIDDLTK